MHVHGNNLEQKENHPSKYRSTQSKAYLAEIRVEYDKWKKKNLLLKGPVSKQVVADDQVIRKRVRLLNGYKDFLDQQRFAEEFDSRSNLHSTALEEFLLYLFKDLVADISKNALIGKSHTFKDLFFRADSFADMLDTPKMLIEKKDHDFAIGVRIAGNFKCVGSEKTEFQSDTWDVPAIAIECKTYLDKTMLQDASTAAEQLKHRNPNARYIVVAEWLKLTESVNLRKLKIDQIYVLRKQKNTDREFRYLDGYIKNPIYPEPVVHLFNEIRSFLTESWDGTLSHGLERGYLI